MRSRWFVACVVSAGCVLGVEPEPEWCEGEVELRYAPLRSEELELFPDDLLTRADSGSATGLRPDLRPEVAGWVAGVPAPFLSVIEGLELSSGFARGGGAVFRFTGDVGEFPAFDLDGTAEGLQWWELGERPARVAYRTELSEDGTQLLVHPLRPLRAATRHAILLTTAHRTPSGQCVRPSATMRGLLSGEAAAPELAPMLPRYHEALEAIGLRADEVSAAALFTTHDELSGMVAVAEEVKRYRYDWEPGTSCEVDEERGLERCTGSFVASDYRVAGGVVGQEPVAPWTLRVDMWRRQGERRALPVVVYGHGMNSRRSEGRLAAERLAALGVAVVAVDAVSHGEHPTADDPDLAGVRFLGLDLSAFSFDAPGLRGQFDQTAVDRLQLLELLRSSPDMDGDGLDDFRPERMAYLGVSLGGMLGSSLLTLDDGLEAGALVVAGGHLATFATDTELTELVLPLLEALLGGKDAVSRFLLVAQAAIDGSDPSVYGAHLLHDRLTGEVGPHLLLPVAMQDAIVPPETSKALARSLGLPHLGPVAVPVEGLEVAGAGPWSANVDGRTAGYYQYDRITEDGALVLAEHQNTPVSDEAVWQWRRFFETWLSGTPEIGDPYAELGTPELVP
jgi:dienelactone hydrolase